MSMPDLVGMVHLLPLPGSPRFAGSVDQVVNTAVEDAEILAKHGFPGLMIENFGDVPFYAEQVPPETIAAMTSAVNAVAELGIPFAVNVLRNDALAALAIAAATGASAIRVNVLTGTMFTDQGPIHGRAAEVLRKRALISPDTEIWADVGVKHATPPSGFDLALSAVDTVERGLADAVIVSGSGTGMEPDLEQAESVRDAIGKSHRIVIGSGATPDNLAHLAEVANTVIVGSFLKKDGEASNRPDPARVGAMFDAASRMEMV